MSEEILKEKKCEYNKFQRLRYFHGMLLDDKDFTIEQQYHIEKRKLHNRMLHGWGVVCGLDIEKIDSNSFKVKPGMALDCRGNEILVCNEITVNLTDSTCSSSKEKGKPTIPNEGNQKTWDAQNEIIRYIGIRYNEKATAPIPVYTSSDQCGKQDCANSKWKEGYCIELLETCPESNDSGYGIHSKLLKCMNKKDEGTCDEDQNEKNDLDILCECMKDISNFFCKEEPTIPCPDCCSDKHYVGLGKIILNNNRSIKRITHDECRQHILGSYLTRYTLNDICSILDLILNKCLRMEEMDRRIDYFENQISKLENLYKKRKPKKA